MAKIPFNIDYRPQIESGEYKVVTAVGDPVRILAWDLPGDYPIAAAKWEEGDPHSTVVDTYDPDGWDGMGTKQPDLYVITPELELDMFESALLRYAQDAAHAQSDAELEQITRDSSANLRRYALQTSEDYLKGLIAKASKSWAGVDVDSLMADLRDHDNK